MSLINDALKRAKEAQPTPRTAPTSVPLRPVESATVGSNASLLPPLSLAAVAMLAMVVIWQWIHARQMNRVAAVAKPAVHEVKAPVPAAKPLIVTAKEAARTQPKPVSVQVPIPAPPPPVVKSPVATPATAGPSIRTSSPPVQAATPVSVPIPAPPPATVQAANTASNPVKTAEIALNLQAIVFDPKRPSAMINGRTLFLGDHAGDYRISAISRRTVTVVKPGKTNVLVLRD